MESFVIRTMEPGQPLSNISVLSAELVAQAPPSCRRKAVAPLNILLMFVTLEVSQLRQQREVVCAQG